jgi:hypothetical protein
MLHSFKIGDKLTHKFRGECTYTEQCWWLDKIGMGSYDGVHVEIKGEVQEVSLCLVERKNDI